MKYVLLAWREAKSAEVLAKRPKLTEKELAKLGKELELNPQQSPFSNKTKWTLRKVYEEDHTLLEENFRAYINGFSKNVDDIIEHFNYRATIGTMVKNKRARVPTSWRKSWACRRTGLLRSYEANVELPATRPCALAGDSARDRISGKICK